MCVCMSVGVQFACASVNVFEFRYVIRIEECYFQAYRIETQSQAVLIKNARTATVPMHVYHTRSHFGLPISTHIVTKTVC